MIPGLKVFEPKIATKAPKHQITPKQIIKRMTLVSFGDLVLPWQFWTYHGLNYLFKTRCTTHKISNFAA
jgi:hypothetical protein